jgi:hypothetical protein
MKPCQFATHCHNGRMQLRVTPTTNASRSVWIDLQYLPGTAKDGATDATATEVCAWLKKAASDWELDALGIPRPTYPGKLKLEPVSRTVDGKEVQAKRFTFPEYPQLVWFVAKSSRGFWKVREDSTGMTAGCSFSSTQRDAIGKQWRTLENMREAPRHAGSATSVETFVLQCIKHEMDKRLATQATLSPI